MLYELLTGQRPFASVRIDHFRNAGGPVYGAAAVSLHARKLPRGVDDLVAMLLAVRPEDRLPSAMAVVDHLPRCLPSSPP